jgi:hypothetical protein
MMASFDYLSYEINSCKKVTKAFPVLDWKGLDKQLEEASKTLSPLVCEMLHDQLKEASNALPILERERLYERLKGLSKLLPCLVREQLYEYLEKAGDDLENISRAIPDLQDPRKRQFFYLRAEKLSLEFSSRILRDLIDSVRKPLLSDRPLNSTSLNIIPNSFQQEEQNPSQTTNKSHLAPASPKATTNIRLGPLEQQVLREIYDRITGNNNNPVKWSPSDWFRKEKPTQSKLCSLSNIKGKLIKKELVTQETERKFSKNSGNATTYVSLTSTGYQLAIQLVNSD